MIRNIFENFAPKREEEKHSFAPYNIRVLERVHEKQ